MSYEKLFDLLPSVTYERSIGKYYGEVFQNRVRKYKTSRMTLQTTNWVISSPHKKGVTSLETDATEERFLLAGSSDATLSIYDLSKWGREKKSQGRRNSFYAPIARSMRVITSNRQQQQPTGHSSSIVKAEWYAFDTGAFISSSLDGSLMVWDTQSMQPVISWHPMSSISCSHLSKSSGRSESLVALGSREDSTIKLLDIRSGAASHSLIGHSGGITTLQWCPSSDVILASGSLDGSIRLWDIRKAGSLSTVTVLDQNNLSPFPLQSFGLEYEHLRRRKEKNAEVVGPNTYRNSSHILSHNSSVVSLSFTPDSRFIVSYGHDRRISLWDLSSTGHMVTRQYASFAGTGSVDGISSDLFIQDKQIWLASQDKILAYSLERGGLPTQTLEGHLASVLSLSFWKGGLKIFSGGKDGMILTWGS